MSYRMKVSIKEVRGRCAMGYTVGDCFVVERYYIREVGGKGVCLHALASMLTPLAPFLKDVPARMLSIGKEDDVGHIQCPYPGEPHTSAKHLGTARLFALQTS